MATSPETGTRADPYARIFSCCTRMWLFVLASTGGFQQVFSLYLQALTG
jgi:hypothetical protein